MVMDLWISEQVRLLKGTLQRTGIVVEHNAESMQSGAVYIFVLYSFTFVRLLVYPVPKPSLPGRMLNFTEIHR